MDQLFVNLSDGSTLSFTFEKWKQWAAHIESGYASGFSVRYETTSTRFKMPRNFKRSSARVKPLKKDGVLKGVCVQQFADNTIVKITLYTSGVVVSGIEKRLRSRP